MKEISPSSSAALPLRNDLRMIFVGQEFPSISASLLLVSSAPPGKPFSPELVSLKICLSNALTGLPWFPPPAKAPRS